jgi:23S rRNA (adenine2030-N6)-methyltransferase
MVYFALRHAERPCTYDPQQARMNYRHAFHAGNFADVAKHLALVFVLGHLRKKDAPFAAIDTHAGRGAYDLDGEDARRTGEAANGIARLCGLQSKVNSLAAYLELVRESPLYPGSPLLAARLLRPQDRLVAIEKHKEDAAALSRVLRPYRNARAECGEGYARLMALLPPPERRGVVLIDPPYEEQDEFAGLARAFAAAYRRFATGIYMIWFPIKSRAAADGLCGEVLAGGAKKMLRLDVAIGAASADKLGAAGLAVVNPPYGFEAEMRAALGEILPRLGENASARIDWLAGSE